MVRVISATTDHREVPLGMADRNVAGRRIDSDLERGGHLPQAEIAQSNVGYYAGPRKCSFRPNGTIGPAQPKMTYAGKTVAARKIGIRIWQGLPGALYSEPLSWREGTMCDYSLACLVPASPRRGVIMGWLLIVLQELGRSDLPRLAPTIERQRERET